MFTKRRLAMSLLVGLAVVGVGVAPAMASPTAANVRPGSSLVAVQCVQVALAGHYGLSRSVMPIDGLYGAATTRWVKEVQRENSLRQTGIVDKATGDRLMGTLRGNPTWGPRCQPLIPTSR